jgi:hypothetical protein
MLTPDDATILIQRVGQQRVCDEELKLRRIGYPRRLPDRVSNVYRAERQFGSGRVGGCGALPARLRFRPWHRCRSLNMNLARSHS